VEKQLGKLDDLALDLDLDLDKEATLGKLDDAKPNLESNCTFVEGKELEK
jgi:hypothetical protein